MIHRGLLVGIALFVCVVVAVVVHDNHEHVADNPQQTLDCACQIDDNELTTCRFMAGTFENQAASVKLELVELQQRALDLEARLETEQAQQIQIQHVVHSLQEQHSRKAQPLKTH